MIMNKRPQPPPCSAPPRAHPDLHAQAWEYQPICMKGSLAQRDAAPLTAAIVNIPLRGASASRPSSGHRRAAWLEREREIDLDHGLCGAAARPYICLSEALSQMPHRGSARELRIRSCQKTAAHAPSWGGL